MSINLVIHLHSFNKHLHFEERFGIQGWSREKRFLLQQNLFLVERTRSLFLKMRPLKLPTISLEHLSKNLYFTLDSLLNQDRVNDFASFTLGKLLLIQHCCNKNRLFPVTIH